MLDGKTTTAEKFRPQYKCH